MMIFDSQIENRQSEMGDTGIYDHLVGLEV